MTFSSFSELVMIPACLANGTYVCAAAGAQKFLAAQSPVPEWILGIADGRRTRCTSQTGSLPQHDTGPRIPHSPGRFARMVVVLGWRERILDPRSALRARNGMVWRGVKRSHHASGWAPRF